MKNNSIYTGVVVAIITTLIGIIIALCSVKIQWVVCNTTCSNYGQTNDCYVVSQSFIDYILNRD